MSGKGLANGSPGSENGSLGNVRRRTCTANGEQFFLKTVVKNRSNLYKKILSYVHKIDNLLANENIDDARKLFDILSEVYLEFNRTHLRFLELDQKN